MTRFQICRVACVCVSAALALTAMSSRAITVHALDDGFGKVAIASPELVARSVSVREVYGNGDADVNPGERVVLSLPVRNAGLAAAMNVTLTRSNDRDVDSRTEYGIWRKWDVGSTVALSYDLEISPAATPHDVTMILTFRADNGGPWRFIVTFPIVARPIDFTKISHTLDDAAPEGNADGRMDAGERVLLGIRLRNDGPADGEDVRISLASRNPLLTVLAAEATHASWPAGEERDTFFVFDIASHATTRSIPLSVTISVDGEEPWILSLYVPVVGQDPDLSCAPSGYTTQSLAATETASPRRESDSCRGCVCTTPGVATPTTLASC